MRLLPRFKTPRAKRRFLLAAFGAVASVCLLVSLGRILVREDPLVRADAIYVLGGAPAYRWLEAVDLYHEGYAPLIILSGGSRDDERLFDARGVRLPKSTDTGRDVLVRQLGLPASAVAVIDEPVDNTAQEAIAIHGRAVAAGWHRLIVITDRSSSRRTGFAFRRELPSSIDVVVRGSRHDPFDVWRWWRTRVDVRSAMYETPKLLAYWLGLRG